ncbi:hypothetical protein BGW38_002226 [Lunasporangiospora selenospora]|uniref:Uncharacterized protein n=1 Tax=Lunasporangiospora selenospora TaxID=979761 RepID=A0A9P6FSW0_9FUNG|nr:hypothetical protein BGW38_002226 [Lunasporangiospora selenospora]
MLKFYLAVVLCACAILNRPTYAYPENFIFYEEHFQGRPCSGGMSRYRDASSNCVDGRYTDHEIFQSVVYDGILSGRIEAYSLQNNNNCGVFVSHGSVCASSGGVPLITAAKFVIPPCKTPSLCFAMEQQVSKANADPNDMDGAWAWTDIESDQSWVLIPGTFNEGDFKMAKLGGKGEEYIKGNYTFYAPHSQRYNKKARLYRDANYKPN